MFNRASTSLVALLVASSITIAPTLAEAAESPKNPSGARLKLLSYCPSETTAVEEKIAPVLGVILGAVAAPIIKAAIDGLAEGMKSYKEGYSSSSTTRSAEFLFRKTGNAWHLSLKCIALLRGALDKDSSEAKDKFWTEGQPGGRVLREFNVTAPPEFYFEAKVVDATGAKAFRIVPNVLWFMKPAARHTSGTFFGGNGHKDIALTLIFENPVAAGKENTGNLFATATLAFEKLDVGTKLNMTEHPGRLADVTSQWLILPDADLSKVSPDSANVTYPYSVLATVQETEDAGDLLLKISSALSENKDKLANALNDLIQKALKEKSDSGK